MGRHILGHGKEQASATLIKRDGSPGVRHGAPGPYAPFPEVDPLSADRPPRTRKVHGRWRLRQRKPRGQPVVKGEKVGVFPEVVDDMVCDHCLDTSRHITGQLQVTKRPRCEETGVDREGKVLLSDDA